MRSATVMLVRKWPRTMVLLSMLFAGSYATAAELKMSYNSDWPPYSSGVGNAVTGLLPNLMTEIVEKRMGMTVSHHGYPWNRAQKAIADGSLDAMVTVPTENRLAYAKSSENTVYTIEMRPIVATGGAAAQMVTAAPNIDTIKGLRICDIFGNGWGEAFAKTNGLTPILATKVSSCLRMTAIGRTDVTIQSVAVANSEIAIEELGDKLTILPATYGTMEFALLLSKKSNVGDGFMAAFDKLLADMIADGSYAQLINTLRSRASN